MMDLMLSNKEWKMREELSCWLKKWKEDGENQ